MTGASKNTIVKLLAQLGKACAEYQAEHIRHLDTRYVQVDEIWSFVGCKEKGKAQGKIGHGDVWTWVAIDAETKLVITWYVGLRDEDSCLDFLLDLAERLTNRVQLTSDGFKLYRAAIGRVFGSDIDYGMLVKTYGSDPQNEVRYSPAICLSAKPKKIFGDPIKSHISTSFVERQNLTMRMGMRRFTRLTNAFSKKLESHEAAIALHYMYYNFCRVHQTLGTTPAIANSVSDHIWTIDEICGLLSK
jgi:IS1 family transposase